MSDLSVCIKCHFLQQIHGVCLWTDLYYTVLYAKSFYSSFAYQLAFVSWAIHTAASKNLHRVMKSAECAWCCDWAKKKYGNSVISISCCSNRFRIATEFSILSRCKYYYFKNIATSRYYWSVFLSFARSRSIFPNEMCLLFENLLQIYNENAGNAIYSWEMSSWVGMKCCKWRLDLMGCQTSCWDAWKRMNLSKAKPIIQITYNFQSMWNCIIIKSSSGRLSVCVCVYV